MALVSITARMAASPAKLRKRTEIKLREEDGDQDGKTRLPVGRINPSSEQVMKKT
jgi:hypothetical protein